MAKENTEQFLEEDENPSFSSKALKILAYPVSAALGLWTGRVNISDAAYDNCKNFSGLIGVREDGVKGLKDKFETAVQNIERSIDNSGFPESVSQYRKKYFPIIEQRKKALGINSIVDEWKVIHRSQKQNAIINGLTISAVSLGAMLAAANIKGIHRVFFKKEKEQNPPEPSL